MITVSQLSAFDRAPWDRFAGWARARAASARDTSTDLGIEATRVEMAWPDENGRRAAGRLRQEAAAHLEIASWFSTVDTGVSNACTAMVRRRSELRAVVLLVGQDEYLAGPDESGHVTHASGNKLNLRSVWEHLSGLTALQLTIRSRTALLHATGLDRQTQLLLNSSSDSVTQTATDGPLDLSDSGIALQAEVNAQGRYGSCVTLALLLGLARANPGFVRRHVRWDPDTNTYKVTLYRSGVPVTTSVSPSSIEGEGADAAGVDRVPTWLSVYEKAIEQEFGDIDDPQRTRVVLARLTGEQALPSAYEPSLQDIERAVAQEPPGTVVAGTSGGSPQPDGVDPAKRVVPHHAYLVRGIDAAGNVVLQNPWGPAGGYDAKGRYYPGVVRLTPAEYHRWFGTGVVAKPPG